MGAKHIFCQRRNKFVLFSFLALILVWGASVLFWWPTHKVRRRDGGESEDSSSTRRRVLVLQTSGLGEYTEPLSKTREVNERWAIHHHYDYKSFAGVLVGGEEWLSTFNKAFLLNDEAVASRYDLVFYLDADAMIQDIRFDIANLSITRGAALAAHSAGGPSTPIWNVNAGVMLWDLRHTMSKEILGRWADLCKGEIVSVHANGKLGQDDQQLLHHVLREAVESGGYDEKDWDAEKPLITELHNWSQQGKANENKQIVLHFLRGGDDNKDWSGSTVPRRIKQAVDALRTIPWHIFDKNRLYRNLTISLASNNRNGIETETVEKLSAE